LNRKSELIGKWESREKSPEDRNRLCFRGSTENQRRGTGWGRRIIRSERDKKGEQKNSDSLWGGMRARRKVHSEAFHSCAKRHKRQNGRKATLGVSREKKTIVRGTLLHQGQLRRSARWSTCQSVKKGEEREQNPSENRRRHRRQGKESPLSNLGRSETRKGGYQAFLGGTYSTAR